MKNSFNKFIILTERRCGSNLLCYTLDSNEKCICFREIFSYHGHFTPFLNKNDTIYNNYNISLRDSNQLEFINNIFKYRAGKVAIGAKVFYDHLNKGGHFLLRDKNVKKIILYRDSSARFISLLQLANSLEWYTFNSRHDSSYNIKVFFSPFDYLNFRNSYLYSHINIINFLNFHNHQYIIFPYSDLLLENKYSIILDFIGLQYDNEFNKLKLLKQGHLRFKDRIANYNSTIKFLTQYFPYCEIYKEFLNLSRDEEKCDDILEVEASLVKHLNFINSHMKELSNRSFYWKDKYFNNIFLMLNYLAKLRHIRINFNTQYIKSNFQYDESEIQNIYSLIGDALKL